MTTRIDLAEWALFNREVLAHADLVATGTTRLVLAEQLGVAVERVHNGPLGGDQQIGAMIAEGLVDMLVFFADPLQPMPHDPDVKALLRLAMVGNVPVACNRASADFLVSSSVMSTAYTPLRPSYACSLGPPAELIGSLGEIEHRSDPTQEDRAA